MTLPRLQICQRHRLHHEWFERLAGKVVAVSPPCMSDAEDWEGPGGLGRFMGAKHTAAVVGWARLLRMGSRARACVQCSSVRPC